ncbi:MAG: hypothetical protein QXR56_06420, partial [Thermofilaceae archaeon]
GCVYNSLLSSLLAHSSSTAFFIASFSLEEVVGFKKDVSGDSITAPGDTFSPPLDTGYQKPLIYS